MLVSCWSAKGGSGATVVAAALSVLLARTNGSLLVDLAGDQPAALGLPEPTGPGLADWVAAGPDVDPGALDRIAMAVGPGLHLLHAGATSLPSSSGSRLLAALDQAAAGRAVVVDCGTLSAGPPVAVAAEVAAASTMSLLVTRPCYLALRRAMAVPVRPSGVVLLREGGRALSEADVASVVGAPVRAAVEVHPQVARAVDAGLLTVRLPRALVRPLARLTGRPGVPMPARLARPAGWVRA